MKAERTALTLFPSLSIGITWVAVVWRSLTRAGVHYILAERRDEDIVLYQKSVNVRDQS